MYKVGIMSEACGTIPLLIPLVIPLCLESPSPVHEPLLLTWNPSFAHGAIPVHSGPRLLVNWPPPPPSLPILFSRSPTVPQFKYAPSYDDITTSALHSPIQWDIYKTFTVDYGLPLECSFGNTKKIQNYIFIWLGYLFSVFSCTYSSSL
jgi:hypothetical protein